MIAFSVNGLETLMSIAEAQPASTSMVLDGILEALIQRGDSVSVSETLIKYASSFSELSIRHVSSLLELLTTYQHHPRACVSILFKHLPMEVPRWILNSLACPPGMSRHWVWGSIDAELQLRIKMSCGKTLNMMLEECIRNVDKLSESTLAQLSLHLKAYCFLCLHFKEQNSTGVDIVSQLHRLVKALQNVSIGDKASHITEEVGEVVLITAVVTASGVSSLVELFNLWHQWSTAPPCHLYLGICAISLKGENEETAHLIQHVSKILEFNILKCEVSESLLEVFTVLGSHLSCAVGWDAVSIKSHLLLHPPTTLFDTSLLNAYVISMSGCFSDGETDLHDLMLSLLKATPSSSLTPTIPSDAAVSLLDRYISKCLKSKMRPLFPLEFSQLGKQTGRHNMVIVLYYALKYHNEACFSSSPLPPSIDLLSTLANFPVERCYQAVLKHSSSKKQDDKHVGESQFGHEMLKLISKYFPEVCETVYIRRRKRPLSQDNNVHESMAKFVWRQCGVLTSQREKSFDWSRLKALLCINEDVLVEEGWKYLKETVLPTFSVQNSVDGDDEKEYGLLVAEVWCRMLQHHCNRQSMIVETVNILLKCQVLLSWSDLVREPLLLVSLPIQELGNSSILRIILSSLDLVLVACKSEGSHLHELDILRSEQYVKSGSEMKPQEIDNSLRHLLLECMITRSLLALCEVKGDVKEEVRDWILKLYEKDGRLLQVLAFQGLTFVDYMFIFSIKQLEKGETLTSLLQLMLTHSSIDVKLSGLTLAAALSANRRQLPEETVILCVNMLVVFGRAMQFREALTVQVFKSSLEDLSNLISCQDHISEETHLQLKLLLNTHTDLVPSSIKSLITSNISDK